jgi:hypothetical protein
MSGNHGSVFISYKVLTKRKGSNINKQEEKTGLEDERVRV